MHDDDRIAAEWAARVDLDTLAAALSIPNQDSPTARAARAEWDRRTNDAHTLRAPTVSERIRAAREAYPTMDGLDAETLAYREASARRREARAQITGYDSGYDS